ncbi:MAG: radical SAM protein [Myxococcota bacterium]
MSPRASRRLAMLDDVPQGSLLVHEVYRSLQGESTHQGRPCVFIRLSVCDLRCRWCDTGHAFHHGDVRRPEAVIDEVVALQPPGPEALVEVTGGEPLLQAAVHPLLSGLCDLGYELLLETSGGRDIALVDPRVAIIMDVKCPDSGESDSNYWPNLERLRPRDELKFVVASRGDFDWARDVIETHRLAGRCPILFSAVWGKVPLTDLADWVAAATIPGARMQLQLHKFVWGAAAQGV